MWTKGKINIDSIDSTIVRRDYIVFEGRQYFSFCDENSPDNVFKRSIRAPIFQVIKVHRNHPLRITSCSHSYFHVKPLDDNRMPAQIWRDKKAYDCVSLILIPFIIYPPDAVKEKLAFLESLADGFLARDNSVSDASLYYIPHGFGVDGSHGLTYSVVSPSQVVGHLYSWFSKNHPIYSNGRVFADSQLEGDIKIPLTKSIELTFEFAKKFEERYNSELMFEDYKRGCEMNSPGRK